MFVSKSILENHDKWRERGDLGDKKITFKLLLTVYGLKVCVTII